MFGRLCAFQRRSPTSRCDVVADYAKVECRAVFKELFHQHVLVASSFLGTADPQLHTRDLAKT